MGNVCKIGNVCNPRSSDISRDTKNIEEDPIGEDKVLISTPSGDNSTPIEAIPKKHLDIEVETQEATVEKEFEFKKQQDLDDYFGLFDVTFQSRPFGFGCDPAVEGNYLEVSSIQKDELVECGLHVGALIVGCNLVYFEEANMDVDAIIKHISEEKVPVTLHFAVEKKKCSGQRDQLS